MTEIINGCPVIERVAGAAIIDHPNTGFQVYRSWRVGERRTLEGARSLAWSTYPEPRDAGEARKALAEWFAAWGTWHLDESPEDVVHGNGKRLFTDAQARAAALVVNAAFEHLPGEEPWGIAWAALADEAERAADPDVEDDPERREFLLEEARKYRASAARAGSPPPPTPGENVTLRVWNGAGYTVVAGTVEAVEPNPDFPDDPREAHVILAEDDANAYRAADVVREAGR